MATHETSISGIVAALPTMKVRTPKGHEVDLHEMIGHLGTALKELHARVEQLESKVRVLEAGRR